ADRNRSHWSTSKTPSYTKSVSWQHHLIAVKTKNSINNQRDIINLPYISTAPEVGLKTLS
ncbi:hypothetical protein RNQ04_19870, partial [Escherichia coli]|nr:hypothetical protein [Escherichia coli]